MELTDAARGRAVIERWCVVAEQRLEYLTELFESGRWRRFFSETAFLENIQEAKAAVETWRDLLYREATIDNQPIDLSWLGHNKSLPPRQIFYLSDETATDSVQTLHFASTSVSPAHEYAPAAIDDELSSVPRLSIVPSVEPEEAAEPDVFEPIGSAERPAWQHALDLGQLAQRYPLLRKAG
ncbi:TIGR03809 family protein [Rhodopseudomonas palustris]|uniref:TIGR03809 family protein n=1 Tax=Rhodopseudomonas palustris TaxID=1076 RepID=UPI002ACDF076|nr:TIGR03809 family protein [Rhodopseudomonas palustris]WQH00090.1 TIGR03809 family protein [Rhodopseudomonas palustris]